MKVDIGVAVDGYIADTAFSLDLTEDLGPGKEVRAKYRGSDWTVRNVSDVIIAGGSRAKIVKADGLTLHVVAE